MHQTVSFFFFTFDFKLNGFLKVSIFFVYTFTFSRFDFVSILHLSPKSQIFLVLLGYWTFLFSLCVFYSHGSLLDSLVLESNKLFDFKWLDCVLIVYWFQKLLAASALNMLFTSMHSPGQLTQWTASGGNPCGQNWRGVTCSRSRVTQLLVIFFCFPTLYQMVYLVNNKVSLQKVIRSWALWNTWIHAW